MSFLALDPSKSNTGWCRWKRGYNAPRYGSTCLGTSFTSRGMTFKKLRILLIDQYTVDPFDVIFAEAPIAHLMRKNSSTENARLALGFAATIEETADELGISKDRIFEYDPKSQWQPGFCGRDEDNLIRRAAKAAQKSSRDPIKAAVMERCRIYGFSPSNSDEADAIGIMTYGLLSNGITPPWLANETLRAPLGVRA